MSLLVFFNMVFFIVGFLKGNVVDVYGSSANEGEVPAHLEQHLSSSKNSLSLCH